MANPKDFADRFGSIRQLARIRRDKIIAEARAEFEDALRKIAVLEQDLLGDKPTKRKTQTACIESLIPSDRTFTITDLLTGLEAMDPKRVWRRRSIDGHIQRLREKGILRRVQRARGRELAVYVRVGVEVEAVPFGDRPLADVLLDYLSEHGPLTQTEIAVRLKAEGYPTQSQVENFRLHVGQVLNRGGEFQRNGDKWSVVG